MRLLLRCYPPNPAHERFGHYAVVYFDDALRETVRLRRALFEGMRNVKDAPCSLNFRNEAPRFYPKGSKILLPEKGSRLMEELLYEEADDLLTLPTKARVLHRFLPVDTVTMVIDPFGVLWTARSASPGLGTETASISYRGLFPTAGTTPSATSTTIRLLLKKENDDEGHQIIAGTHRRPTGCRSAVRGRWG